MQIQFNFFQTRRRYYQTFINLLKGAFLQATQRPNFKLFFPRRDIAKFSYVPTVVNILAKHPEMKERVCS